LNCKVDLNKSCQPFVIFLDSPRYIEHMQVIDKLQKALIEADQLIKNERREKKQLESDLHKEFRKKIAAHTAKIEADHE